MLRGVTHASCRAPCLSAGVLWTLRQGQGSHDMGPTNKDGGGGARDLQEAWARPAGGMTGPCGAPRAGEERGLAFSLF